jgi:hypothetical protein
MPDWWEKENNLDPNDKSDRDVDKDGDGLTNYEEYSYNKQYNIRADNPDTDGDGYTDKEELDKGTDPTDESDFPKSTSWWSIILLILLIAALLGGAGYYVYVTYFDDKKGKGGQGQMFAGNVQQGQRGGIRPGGMLAPGTPAKSPMQRLGGMFKQKDKDRAAERSKLFDSFSDASKKDSEGKKDIAGVDKTPDLPKSSGIKQSESTEEVADFKKPDLKGAEWIEVGQKKEDPVSTAFKKLSRLVTMHKEDSAIEQKADVVVQKSKEEDPFKQLKKEVKGKGDAFSELSKISNEEEGDSKDPFKELKKISGK